MSTAHRSHCDELGMESGESWRKELGIGAVVPIEIPGDVLAAQTRRNAMSYLDVTAAICGDPLPGESAYERMPEVTLPEVTIAPYDPVRNYVPYQVDDTARSYYRCGGKKRRRVAHKGEG